MIILRLKYKMRIEVTRREFTFLPRCTEEFRFYSGFIFRLNFPIKHTCDLLYSLNSSKWHNKSICLDLICGKQDFRFVKLWQTFIFNFKMAASKDASISIDKKAKYFSVWWENNNREDPKCVGKEVRWTN